jgi:hypothetical protein
VETISIETGKSYKTRSGEKAVVFGQHPTAHTMTLCGFIAHGLRDFAVTWNTNGSVAGEGGKPNGNDLIAEWVEPKRIKGWLSIAAGYADAPICETREEAIRRFSGEPAACIFIDVLEGQGLDGSANNG